MRIIASTTFVKEVEKSQQAQVRGQDEEISVPLHDANRSSTKEEDTSEDGLTRKDKALADYLLVSVAV